MKETTRRATRGRGLPIAVGVFLALVAVMIWEAASSHAGYRVTTESDSEDGGAHRIRIREGRWQLAIDLEGDVELTADEAGIARLGPGARLEIEERGRGGRRRLEVTPGRGGVPEIDWSVDRKRAEFDAEGREWLAGVLPRIYRATGFDAEARVGRILARGGVEGVLREIGEIGGDSIQRLYFEQLVARADLAPDELERALRRLGKEIGSDHEMGQALAAVDSASLGDAAVARAFAMAAGTIGSDHELRQVLGVRFRDRELSAATVETLLGVAATVGNDYELSVLLIELAESYPADRPLPAGYARVLATIGNDYEMRRVLGAALGRPGLGAEELERLLSVTPDIGSDFEQAELLVGLAKTWRGELPPAYFRALDTIGSDFEQARALAATAERPDLGPEALAAVLDSSLDVGSDYELAQLLLKVAEKHPIGAALRPAFERAAATIGSDRERRRVLAAAEPGDIGG